jgi:hypothetical protein
MPPSLPLRYLVALTVAFIGAVFVFAGVYTQTQHEPVPHDLGVGVVGPDLTVGLLTKALSEEPISGYFAVTRYDNADSLKSAIMDREVYGGYVQEQDKGLLLTAGGAGKVPQDTLTKVATELTSRISMPLETEDVAPLNRGDTSGLSSYTFQYGLLVPAFFFGAFLFMFAGGVSLLWRLGLIGAYAVCAGILGALTVDQVVGALTGHFFAIAGLGILYSVMAALVTYGLCSVLSWIGLALAGLILILLGNSTGGGSIAQEFLPDYFRPLGQAFPNGPFIRAVRNTVYFDGNHVGQALLVVALWAVGGLALALVAGPLRTMVMGKKPTKAKPARAKAKPAS